MGRCAYSWQIACAILAILLCSSHPAAAQGGVSTSTLSGSIVDTQGAIIPGADIVVTNNATAVAFTAVSEAKRDFVIAGLVPRSICTRTICGTRELVGFSLIGSNCAELRSAMKRAWEGPELLQVVSA